MSRIISSLILIFIILSCSNSNNKPESIKHNSEKRSKTLEKTTPLKMTVPDTKKVSPTEEDLGITETFNLSSGTINDDVLASIKLTYDQMTKKKRDDLEKILSLADTNSSIFDSQNITDLEKLSEYQRNILNNYKNSQDFNSSDTLLIKLIKSISGMNSSIDLLTPSLEKMLDKVDEKGFYRSGAKLDTTIDGNKVIVRTLPSSRRTRNIEKSFLILSTPELITKWPGDTSSAIGVLDPQDGPWEIVSGYSYSYHHLRHGKWKETKKNYKEYSYILSLDKFKKSDPISRYCLLKNDDGIIGWVAKKQGTIFYADRFNASKEKIKRYAEFYKTGIPQFLTGVWQDRIVYNENLLADNISQLMESDEYQNDPTVYPAIPYFVSYGKVYFYDFYDLVYYSVNPISYSRENITQKEFENTFRESNKHTSKYDSLNTFTYLHDFPTSLDTITICDSITAYDITLLKSNPTLLADSYNMCKQGRYIPEYTHYRSRCHLYSQKKLSTKEIRQITQ